MILVGEKSQTPLNPNKKEGCLVVTDFFCRSPNSTDRTLAPRRSERSELLVRMTRWIEMNGPLGGRCNPFGNYASQIGSFAQVGVEKTIGTTT